MTSLGLRRCDAMPVIAAQAAIQWTPLWTPAILNDWIPAFAGMTSLGLRRCDALAV